MHPSEEGKAARGWSHWMSTQEAEHGQEVGLDYYLSNPTYHWLTSSSEAIPQKGSTTFQYGASNWASSVQTRSLCGTSHIQDTTGANPPVSWSSLSNKFIRTRADRISWMLYWKKFLTLFSPNIYFREAPLSSSRLHFLSLARLCVRLFVRTLSC